jgi:hypothetical protein
MERTDITFIHNNSWEVLKKLPGLNDRLGRPHTQFFAFGPHHSLSPDKWGVREVFKRGERDVQCSRSKLTVQCRGCGDLHGSVHSGERKNVQEAR